MPLPTHRLIPTPRTSPFLPSPKYTKPHTSPFPDDSNIACAWERIWRSLLSELGALAFVLCLPMSLMTMGSAAMGAIEAGAPGLKVLSLVCLGDDQGDDCYWSVFPRLLHGVCPRLERLTIAVARNWVMMMWWGLRGL